MIGGAQPKQFYPSQVVPQRSWNARGAVRDNGGTRPVPIQPTQAVPGYPQPIPTPQPAAPQASAVPNVPLGQPDKTAGMAQPTPQAPPLPLPTPIRILQRPGNSGEPTAMAATVEHNPVVEGQGLLGALDEEYNKSGNA